MKKLFTPGEGGREGALSSRTIMWSNGKMLNGSMFLCVQAINCDNWEEGQPLQVEEDFWDDSILQVMSGMLDTHTVTLFIISNHLHRFKLIQITQHMYTSCLAHSSVRNRVHKFMIQPVYK